MAIQFQLSCEGVDGILDRLGKCFEWFGMHCRKLKYSIEYLEKSKNELKCTVKMVDDTIKDAEHNGRKPIEMARGWVQQGEDYISRANGVVEVYNKRADEPTSTIISIVFCPCETVSRRTLNCEAIMRMNQIFAHKEDGKKYATGVFEDVSYTGSSVPHALHGSSNSQNKPFIQAEIEHYRSTQLDGFAKYKAFVRCESLDCVPVVIRVNAPAYYIHGSRAAVDLVMVLDASASMRLDGKLDQVKQGSIFVIHNLDAEDRLSIVSFGKKRVILPLTSMSGDGKRLANRKVRSLKPVGTSTAGPAMELAYEILDNRSYKKPVSTILLLSGGQDKQIFEESLRCKYREIFSRNRREYPTYTFGFGLDHDPRMLYYLATGGCGTYSYVTKNKSIRDAMALCIGGLTSIVAQKVKISIDPADRDVKISGMVCGGYSHHVAPGGESGFIIINDLYASEEKNFIVYVNVPAADEAAGFPRTALTKLLTVTANYYCPLSKAYVRTDPVEISVERPRRVWDQDRDISAEVASEVTRTNIFNGVKDIWLKSSQCTQYSMNVRIANEDIKSQLASLRDSIDGTEEAKAAKEKWEDLSSDLSNMIDDISEIFYMIKLSKDSGIDVSSQVTGLPYMLSWLSSHQWQRAATPGAISESKWFNFRTTRMQNMIDSVDSAPSAYIE